jgi:ribonuclease Z
MSLSRLPFTVRLVNGIDGDPAVVLSPHQKKYHLLFDCGDLSALSHKEIIRVRYLCISHCHIDHFIGFDRLLRHRIPRYELLHIYGPKDMAQRIYAKLCSYTWNLLEPGQLLFEVHEIGIDGSLRVFRLENSQNFVPQLIGSTPGHKNKVADLGVLEDGMRLSAIILDHGIPVVSYRVDFPLSMEFDVEAALRDGLSPGPWISTFKHFLLAGDLDRAIACSDGQNRSVKTLAAAYTLETHQSSFGYLTDIEDQPENRERIQALLSGVTYLVSESCFDASHEDRAKDRKHLTSRQAGSIAAMVGAREFLPFHISKIYQGADAERVVQEALDFWRGDGK